MFGHNMFQYTHNNPVMYTDSTEYAREWVNSVSEFCKGVWNVYIITKIIKSNQTQTAISTLLGGAGTVSAGLGVSGSYILFGSYISAVAIDHNGSYAIQSIPSGGIMSSLNSISVFLISTFSTAKSIHDLEGFSLGSGASVGVPIPPFFAGLFYGFEGFIPISSENSFLGVSIMGGASWIASPEVHLELSYTENLRTGNFYDDYRRFLEKLILK